MVHAGATRQGKATRFDSNRLFDVSVIALLGVDHRFDEPIKPGVSPLPPVAEFCRSEPFAKGVVCQNSADDFREQIQQVEHTVGTPISDDFGTPGPS
jgi:hypothetical protein